jgi:hypothetical protein
MANIPREFFSDPKSPQCNAERTAENVGIGIGIVVALTLIFAPIFFFADAASRSSVEQFEADRSAHFYIGRETTDTVLLIRGGRAKP